MSNNKINWQWFCFNDLAAGDVYSILQARQEVFIVEQQCVYQDADEKDVTAHHLLGKTEKGEIAIYLRILPPGGRFAEPSIGRLLTTKNFRHQGLAREAVEYAKEKCREEYGRQPIKISAQFYLKSFYASLGFSTASSPYDEDGIEHIDMIFSWS